MAIYTSHRSSDTLPGHHAETSSPGETTGFMIGLQKLWERNDELHRAEAEGRLRWNVSLDPTIEPNTVIQTAKYSDALLQEEGGHPFRPSAGLLSFMGGLHYGLTPRGFTALETSNSDTGVAGMLIRAQYVNEYVPHSGMSLYFTVNGSIGARPEDVGMHDIDPTFYHWEQAHGQVHAAAYTLEPQILPKHPQYSS